MRDLEAGNRHELPPPRRTFLVLPEHAAKDAVEPCARSGGIAEIVEGSPRADARLLHRVLGVGHGIGAPHGEGEQTVQVRQDERVEARLPLSGRHGRGRRHDERWTYIGRRAERRKYSVGLVDNPMGRGNSSTAERNGGGN